MNVVQAVVNHPDDRIAGAFCDFLCGIDVGVFERALNLFALLEVAFETFAPPPERTLADHGNGGEGAGKNRPHDRAATAEILEDDIGEHEENFQFRFFNGKISLGFKAVIDWSLGKAHAFGDRPVAFYKINGAAIQNGKSR